MSSADRAFRALAQRKHVRHLDGRPNPRTRSHGLPRGP
jgi:hypothetical protein